MAEPAKKPLVRMEMLSQPRLLAAARAMIGQLADRLGFDESDCSQISLAVDEALCNIINHGYAKEPDGPIWLTVWATETKPPELKIVLEDLAAQVDPETIRSRKLNDIRPGGLGVHIIREVMDGVLYEKRGGESRGMRLTMRKRIPDPSAKSAKEQECRGTDSRQPTADSR